MACYPDNYQNASWDEEFELRFRMFNYGTSLRIFHKNMVTVMLSQSTLRRHGCGCMYNSTHSWSRHQMEMRGQLNVPAALPRGKHPGTHRTGDWL